MKNCIKIISFLLLVMATPSSAQTNVAAPPAPSHELGFGSIKLELLTKNEAAGLREKTMAIEKKYGIRIGWESMDPATIQDLGKDHLGGYADHFSYINGVKKLSHLIIFFNDRTGEAFVFTNNKKLNPKTGTIQSVFKANFPQGTVKAVGAALSRIEEILSGKEKR